MSGIQGLDDRGATPYFRGRKPILKSFKDLLAKSEETSGGSTFLIQGPPGIGKTALLAECWEKAAEAGWYVAEIDPKDLWNANGLRKKLALPPQERKVGKTTGAGVNKIVTVSKKTETEFHVPLDTSEDILTKRTGPVLLVLDEAQHLGESESVNGPYREDVVDLLKKIHNGGVGKPVILLAGGLGMTYAAFRALGISRMKEDSKFDMEPLEKEEERTVIWNWLKKAGGATGDVTHWIDTITKETVQWPRHVDSYARNAARLIKDNHGQMTEDLLRSVMETGREKRMEYYQGRLDDFTARECRSFARMLLASSGEGGIEQEVAVDQLDKEYGAGKGAELFFRAVRRGVFHIDAATKLYSAPIPSLREYIIRNFPPKEQSPDMGLER